MSDKQIMPDVPDLEAKLREAEAQKNGAYSERNCLVALLTALFPSWLTRHPDSDTTWEDDWRWIVGIQLPTGQATWHIHASELQLFAHVERHDVPWDGHTTEQKYERLRAAIDAAMKEKR